MPYVVDIDPVAFTLGPLSVRWYGLAYGAAFLIGAWLFDRALRKISKVPEGIDPSDLLLWAAVGIVGGGRLGEVLLYSPGYYMAHPLEIPMLWHGGMASHGGMIGLAVGAMLWARRSGVAPAAMFDALALAGPQGLFLGRLANFVNQEMVGRATDVAWGVVFPAFDGAVRHPAQLYQALAEGPALFLLVLLVPVRRVPAGTRAAFTLVAYGLLRIWTETYREPTPDLGAVGPLTNGQALSVAMIAVGAAILAALFARARRAARG